MDMLAGKKPIVNGVGAAWFEDLSESFLDDCVDLGVAAVGCTANDTWDDTLESMENLQSVKRVVAEIKCRITRRYRVERQEGGRAYVLSSQTTLPPQDGGSYCPPRKRMVDRE